MTQAESENSFFALKPQLVVAAAGRGFLKTSDSFIIMSSSTSRAHGRVVWDASELSDEIDASTADRDALIAAIVAHWEVCAVFHGI